ncbi:MAG: type II toxin-antitoxin system PemK/MazF family toxin [Candidatus Gracilibacteria bacterium]
MDKDFSKWNTRKQLLHTGNKYPFFHEREVWYCHLGANIGYEQDGKGEDFLRPILIIRKFNKQIFWGIPLTTSFRKSFYYKELPAIAGRKSYAVLSQIRLIDAKRLSYKISTISKTIHHAVCFSISSILLNF